MSANVAQVQASLAQARDTQVARVVAMVDALPDRGAADALIAPLRPRLAQLRPTRPPGFIRVLFTPLNPVIVSASDWQRCGVGVPRPALASLGSAVRAALPGYAELGSGSDLASAHGMALWPAAAVVLCTLAMPADWHESGLGVADYASITAIAAAVLAEAQAIEHLARKRQPVEDAEIWAILSRSKQRGAVALDTVVAVLLARLAVPARVAALATEAIGGDRATGRAIDRLAASLSATASDSGDVREAALEAGRVATMLEALEEGASPERRAQLEQVRRDADALSRRSFNQAVGQTLAMAQSAMTASFDDGAMAAMESLARDLRRLETAARKLGSGAYYDTQLAEAATVMRNLQGDLGLADRVRLVEILSGPEHATALLAEAGRPPAATR